MNTIRIGSDRWRKVRNGGEALEQSVSSRNQLFAGGEVKPTGAETFWGTAILSRFQWTTILWIDEILHHFETMGAHCLLECVGKSNHSRVCEGAVYGFRNHSLISMAPI